jgi:hypothetical protein
VVHFLQRFDEGIEIPRPFVGQEGGELLPLRCDKLLDRRHGVLRLNEVKSGQFGGIEERVGH